MATAKVEAPKPKTEISTPVKAALGVFVLAILGAGFYLVIYSDLVSDLEKAVKQEADLRAQLDKAREIEAEYQRDLADLNAKEQKARELNKVLPESAESPAFLSALQSVANATGVSLNSWDPMDEVPQPFFTKVPMKLKMSGRFHQIAKFFYGVGQLDRIINIENILIAVEKSGSGSSTTASEEVNVSAECLATAFHTGVKRGAQPAAGAKPAAPAASGGH